MDEIRTYEEVLLQVEKEEELESEVEHTLQMFARKVMQSRMVGGKALRDHFRNYDRNKDNTIDKDEFSDALTSFLSGKDMTQESGEKLESKSLVAMETFFFPDGAEELDYDVFINLVMKNAEGAGRYRH